MESLSLAHYLDTLQRSANRRKKQAQIMGAYLKSGKIKKYLEPILAAAALSPDTIEPDVFSGETSIYVTVRMIYLEGMQAPALKGLLEVFTYMEPDEMRTEDYAAGLQRDFKFYFNRVCTNDEGYYTDVIVIMHAQVKSDSATCRRVVTGYTEIEPQPIYALDCSGAQGETA